MRENTGGIADERTALIVVHLINDIAAEGSAFGSIFHEQAQARATVESSVTAMDKVRSVGGTVVGLRIALNKDYSDSNPHIPLLAMAESAGALVEGTDGAKYVPEVVLQDRDIDLVHTRPNGFVRTDLESQLRDRGIQKVVVCGIATNASVETMARHAADLDFETYVLSDASSAADDAGHEAALASLGLFAKVATVAEL